MIRITELISNQFRQSNETSTLSPQINSNLDNFTIPKRQTLSQNDNRAMSFQMNNSQLDATLPLSQLGHNPRSNYPNTLASNNGNQSTNIDNFPSEHIVNGGNPGSFYDNQLPTNDQSSSSFGQSKYDQGFDPLQNNFGQDTSNSTNYDNYILMFLQNQV